MRIIRSTISAADIQEAVGKTYEICPAGMACMLEYRGINDIYICTDGRDSYFLKLYARLDVDRDAVEAEAGIVTHLRQAGLPVAYPIASRDSGYLLPFDAPEGIRYGVLFTEAEGIPCDDEIDGETETAIASLLSTMHTSLDTLAPSPARWRLDERLFVDESLAILEKYAAYHRIDVAFLREVAAEVKRRIASGAAHWSWGLCHGDYYTGNLHRAAGGALTVIDFDLCGYGWRAYDAATFVGMFSRGMSPGEMAKRERRLERFLKAYTHAGGLTDSEADAVLKVFVPFRRLFNMGYLYESLLYVWGNRMRGAVIDRDTALLKQWVEHYWG